MAGSGSRSALKQLRKGTPSKQGSLKNNSGDMVESCSRVDVFAEYLSKVQWAVQRAVLIDEPPLRQLPASIAIQYGRAPEGGQINAL